MTDPAAPAPGLLRQLELEPRHVPNLDREVREPLLRFLHDWGHGEELRLSAEALVEASPRSIVSSLDWLAEAYLLLTDPAAALAAVRGRLEHRDSDTGRALLVRALLALGEVSEARREARAMSGSSAANLSAWRVAMAEGDAAGAMAALRHIGEVSPGSRDYLLGMVAAYQLAGDWVTASGYAHAALDSDDPEAPLSVPHLRQLRDFFRASGEPTQATEAEEALAARHEAGLARLRQLLAGPVASPSPADGRPSVSATQAPDEAPAPPSAMPHVSPAETERVLAAATAHFGFTELRPGQLETITCCLRGESVLTVLPTGGGKSLCYQLPALMDEQGTTLVISPLIALMQDQLDHLPDAARERATFVNSTLDGDELERRLRAIAAGAARLVYAAPERLRQPTFLHALKQAGVNRLVIDEAHCVSVWGHDFRPDYLAIGQARRALGDPPLLAFTATAPERIRRDIVAQLGGMRVIATEPLRPNLRLEAFRADTADAKLGHLLSFCLSEPGSGVVYAGTRDRCEEVARMLVHHGVEAGVYHAGIDDRRGAQDAFMSGRVRVMVATNAFGLGVDKPDIRFVVHYLPPPSLESYYQEAGRGGRDGLPARCLLLYQTSDKGTLTRHARQDSLTIEYLRDVYRAVKNRLHGATVGRVAAADLERDLLSEPVRLRVALGFLEQSGMLRRGPDVPRAATLRLRDATCGGDAEGEAFCRAARLRPGQPLVIDMVAAAIEAGISPYIIEARLLDWRAAGWLDYRPSSRDLLLELLPASPSAATDVPRLLEGRDHLSEQRIAEVMGYCRTARCRHGYVSAYFGGRPLSRCPSCDNCVPLAPPPSALPLEADQALAVLRCLASGGWGRANLALILRGDPTAPLRAKTLTEFAALDYRGETGITGLVDRLIAADFLQERRLDHGGAVVELATKGRLALARPEMVEEAFQPEPARPVALASVTPTGAVPEGGDTTVDGPLLEALRQWRREQASEDGIAPFMVFHDSHLRSIAAARPDSLKAFSRMPGVGPAKLAKYGEAVLAVIAGIEGLR